MKKMKKIITILTTLVLLISMNSVTAFAALETGETQKVKVYVYEGSSWTGEAFEYSYTCQDGSGHSGYNHSMSYDDLFEIKSKAEQVSGLTVTQFSKGTSMGSGTKADFPYSWQSGIVTTSTYPYYISVYAETPVVNTTYTLNYNANGGSGAPASQTKTTTESYADIQVSSVEPTRSEHTFKGWNTNSAGTGTSYSAGSYVTVTGTTTLYAMWEKDEVAPTTYTVTYETNTGEVSTGVTSGGTFTFPASDIENFLYWKNATDTTDTKEYKPGDTYTVTGDVTFVAVHEDTTTPPTGGETEATFNTTLNMGDNAVTAPTTDFTYTVTAGDADEANSITAGIHADVVTVTNASFSTSDILGADADKFVEQSKIDFSNVEFTTPGIYHYVLNAEANSHSGIVMDDTTSLDVYVYVTNDDDGLVISAIVIGDEDSKDDGFEHEYVSETLTISKTVTGNMADMDKAFTFTLTDGASIDEGTIFKVEDASGNISYIAYVNGAFVTATANGFDDNATTVTFDLKNSESYTVYAVVEDMSIEVTEEEYANYTTTVIADGESEATETSVKANVIDGSVDTQETTDFTNEYELDIPETGVILDFLPFIMMVLLAGGLISIRLVKFSKKSKFN